MIKGMQEVIDVMTKAKADLDKNGGLKQVIFVAYVKSGEFSACSGI